MRLPAPLRPLGPYRLPLSLACVLASGLFTVLVLAPEFYLLSVTTVRAMFVWFTWYDEVFYDAQRFLSLAPWVPLPFLMVTIALALRRATVTLVRRWRPPPRPALTTRSKVLRGLLVLALLPSALGLAALLSIPAMSHGVAYYTTTGGALQRDRCSRCHSPYRPFHFIKSAELWKTTVRRMRRLEGAPIDDQQQRKIVAYLTAKASLTDGWIMRAKCLRCHSQGSITAQPRTAAEWRLIIGRVSRISPYAYRLDWRAQLERYARQRLSTPPPAPGTPAAQQLQDRLAFERVCGHCHTLATALDFPPAQTRSMVRRMLRKVPSLASAADEQAMLRFLQQPPRGKAAINKLFPHDQPVRPSW